MLQMRLATASSLPNRLCFTQGVSGERNNIGYHKVCPNLSCLKTCYIINDDTSARTDNDTENPSRPTQFTLPKVPTEHFLQPANNQNKSKY